MSDTKLDPATLRALINKAATIQERVSHDYAAARNWGSFIDWLQAKLDEIPPRETPVEIQPETELAPRTSPDLAKALKEFHEYYREAARCGLGLEYCRKLASAIDAAREDGLL